MFLIYLSIWSLFYKSRGTFLSIIAAAGLTFCIYVIFHIVSSLTECHYPGEDLLRLVCFSVLVCGLLVLSVGITGVCGLVQNTRGCLSLFICLVLVLLTVEAVACVLILLYQPGLLANMRKVVQARLIHDYGREGYESFTTGIDWVQHSLSCCGVVSQADYQNSLTTAWRMSNLSHHRLEVPLTCCSLLNKGVSIALQLLDIRLN